MQLNEELDEESEFACIPLNPERSVLFFTTTSGLGERLISNITQRI